MCVVFIETFVGLRLLDHINAILDKSKHAMKVLGDKEASDDDKEKAAREASLVIFRETGLFTVQVAIILGLMGVIYYGTVEVGSVKPDEFIATATSVTTLVVSLILATVYAKVRYVAR